MHPHQLLAYFPKVEHIIDRCPLVVSQQTRLVEAIALMGRVRNQCVINLGDDLSESHPMGESRSGSVLVVDDQERLVGIFTERDIVRLTVTGIEIDRVQISQVMTPQVITLRQSEFKSIFVALAIFRQHRIRHLPVVDEENRLVGVVTPESIRQVMRPSNLLSWRCVADVMTTNIIQSPAYSNVLQVAQLMNQHRVSCVVITETDAQSCRPVGIMTERDVVQLRMMGCDLEQTTAQQVMSWPLFCMQPDDTLWQAHQEMQRRFVRRLVVVDLEGNLQGLVTQTSLLQALDPVEMYAAVEVLQQLVDERTTELHQTNLQLEREIGDRLLIEAELRKSLAKERELSDLKSRFAAMVSHEFRNPLTAILSSVELLKYYSDRLSEEQKRKHLNNIEVTAQEITQLIDDLLVLNKVEAGKLIFQPEALNVKDYCLELLEGLMFTHGNRHSLQLNFQPEARTLTGVDDPFDVPISPKLLRHILTNLITNAIKYSPVGSPIDVKVMRRETSLVFQIQDSGIGIPSEDQVHLFESFHRAHNVGAISGTGLGLAIVKNCVDLHGGSIQITSQVNVGTCVTVELPMPSFKDLPFQA